MKLTLGMGHTINRNRTSSDSDGHVIWVKGTSNVKIRDTAGGGSLTGGYATNGGGINVDSNATLILPRYRFVLTELLQSRLAQQLLVLSDSEEQAEEHFKKYDMSTVRIAAEDEIYYYRSKGCPVVEL